MKAAYLLIILCFTVSLRADEDREPERTGLQEKVKPDAKLVRALTQLEKRLNVRFDIPFPENYDIDHWRKNPLACFEVSGKKLLFTRPQVNPYDQPRTVEWIIGSEDPAKFGHNAIDCSVDLDESGEFQLFNIIEDWASDGTGNHQIERADGESSPVFFERARLTYQARAKNAKDSATVMLFLQAFEKIATTIQTLSKEESRPTTGTTSK
jgi:hypothetical protein